MWEAQLPIDPNWLRVHALGNVYDFFWQLRLENISSLSLVWAGGSAQWNLLVDYKLQLIIPMIIVIISQQTRLIERIELALPESTIQIK